MHLYSSSIKIIFMLVNKNRHYHIHDNRMCNFVTDAQRLEMYDRARLNMVCDADARTKFELARNQASSITVQEAIEVSTKPEPNVCNICGQLSCNCRSMQFLN